MKTSGVEQVAEDGTEGPGIGDMTGIEIEMITHGHIGGK